MTPWAKERAELPQFAQKHSTNQRVMKRDAQLNRKFERIAKRKERE